MSEPDHVVAWQDLEATIERAATRLRELQEENAALRRRVVELEGSLAAQGSDVEERWQGERLEVARRVDGLVERLEAVLASVAED